jgi:hypothetical protein
MDEFIQENAWYSYKGKIYSVVLYRPGQYLVKDASSGNWSDGVMYGLADTDHEDAELRFVRSAKDFSAKFERHDDTDTDAEGNEA